jgi:hypothetical protein
VLLKDKEQVGTVLDSHSRNNKGGRKMTATTSAAKPEVFTRKASGLVRVLSPYSAFVYNILTMGLIFPWTYLWAPGALPGGKMVWGILLAMVIEIPIAFSYVWLSTA